MVFQCINIRQVRWEVLKTAAFGLGFQRLPRDLANVNAWKTMFDPYIIFCQIFYLPSYKWAMPKQYLFHFSIAGPGNNNIKYNFILVKTVVIVKSTCEFRRSEQSVRGTGCSCLNCSNMSWGLQQWVMNLYIVSQDERDANLVADRLLDQDVSRFSTLDNDNGKHIFHVYRNACEIDRRNGAWKSNKGIILYF